MAKIHLFALLSIRLTERKAPHECVSFLLIVSEPIADERNKKCAHFDRFVGIQWK